MLYIWHYSCHYSSQPSETRTLVNVRADYGCRLIPISKKRAKSPLSFLVSLSQLLLGLTRAWIIIKKRRLSWDTIIQLLVGGIQHGRSIVTTYRGTISFYRRRHDYVRSYTVPLPRHGMIYNEPNSRPHRSIHCVIFKTKSFQSLISCKVMAGERTSRVLTNPEYNL